MIKIIIWFANCSPSCTFSFHTNMLSTDIKKLIALSIGQTNLSGTEVLFLFWFGFCVNVHDKAILLYQDPPSDFSSMKQNAYFYSQAIHYVINNYKIFCSLLIALVDYSHKFLSKVFTNKVFNPGKPSSGFSKPRKFVLGVF